MSAAIRSQVSAICSNMVLYSVLVPDLRTGRKSGPNLAPNKCQQFLVVNNRSTSEWGSRSAPIVTRPAFSNYLQSVADDICGSKTPGGWLTSTHRANLAAGGLKFRKSSQREAGSGSMRARATAAHQTAGSRACQRSRNSGGTRDVAIYRAISAPRVPAGPSSSLRRRSSGERHALSPRLPGSVDAGIRPRSCIPPGRGSLGWAGSWGDGTSTGLIDEVGGSSALTTIRSAAGNGRMGRPPIRRVA